MAILTQSQMFRSVFSEFVSEGDLGAALQYADTFPDESIYLQVTVNGWALSRVSLISDPLPDTAESIYVYVPGGSSDDREVRSSKMIAIFNSKMSRRFRQGRPVGIPRDGNFGHGIKTKVMRVPVGSEDKIISFINDLPSFIESWKERSKDTRDWTQFNRFLQDFQSTFDV